MQNLIGPQTTPPDFGLRLRAKILAFFFCLVLTACQAAAPAGNASALPPTATLPAAPLTLPATPQQPAPEVIGVITFFEGDVLLQAATMNRRPPGLMAPIRQASGHGLTLLQPVNNGAHVNVGAGGSVTIVCVNNRVVRIVGPNQVVVTSQTCNSGSTLPTGASRSVTPDNGQIKVNQGSHEWENEQREKESDYGNVPIILSPRNTALIDRQPAIQWVAVPEAIEYELNLSGSGSFEDVILPAEALACTENSRTSPNLVCTTPWPSTWPLTQGKRYFLTVSARTSIAAPLRDAEKSSLRTLDATAAAQVQATAETIRGLGLDKITTSLLLAGLFAERGVEANDARQALYADAIPLYEQVLAEQPVPVLFVALGDGYRVIDLQRYAFKAYQAALDGLDKDGNDPAVRAAAEFGMGQVEYSRLNFKAAEPHFVKAVELYQQIHAQDELLVAQRSLEETRNRL